MAFQDQPASASSHLKPGVL